MKRVLILIIFVFTLYHHQSFAQLPIVTERRVASLDLGEETVVEIDDESTKIVDNFEVSDTVKITEVSSPIPSTDSIRVIKQDWQDSMPELKRIVKNSIHNPVLDLSSVSFIYEISGVRSSCVEKLWLLMSNKNDGEIHYCLSMTDPLLSGVTPFTLGCKIFYDTGETNIPQGGNRIVPIRKK